MSLLLPSLPAISRTSRASDRKQKTVHKLPEFKKGSIKELSKE